MKTMRTVQSGNYRYYIRRHYQNYITGFNKYDTGHNKYGIKIDYRYGITGNYTVGITRHS